MDLKIYLAQHDMTHAAFGEHVGASSSTITRLCQKKQHPSFDLMTRIAEVTGGHVMPNDFMGSSPSADALDSSPRAGPESVPS